MHSFYTHVQYNYANKNLIQSFHNGIWHIHRHCLVIVFFILYIRSRQQQQHASSAMFAVLMHRWYNAISTCLAPCSEGAGKKQGLSFSFTMFMWACLFNGIIVYSYFEFFDNGAFIDALITMLSDKQLAQTYTQIGMGESYKEILSMMNEIAQTSSFDKALALFNNNFLLSLLLSIPVALVTKTKLQIVRK